MVRHVRRRDDVIELAASDSRAVDHVRLSLDASYVIAPPPSLACST